MLHDQLRGVDTGLWRPAEEAKEWNPWFFDFRWNADYTLFRLVPLGWSEYSGYAPIDPGAEWDGPDEHAGVERMPVAAAGAPDGDDGLPF